MGEDGKVEQVGIDPNQEEAKKKINDIQTIYNLRVGKYDVTAVPGASYATKRMEQSEILMQFIQNSPEQLAMFGDLLFRMQDYPLADEISKRFEKMLPPGVKPANEGELPPEVQEALAEIQKKEQELMERAQALNEAENEIAKTGIKIGKEAIEAMSKEERVKVELGRIEVMKQELGVIQREIEIDAPTLEAQTKVRLAEIDQETKYVTSLLQEETKDKLARMQDNTTRKVAGTESLEDEEAKEKRMEEEDMRLEQTRQAVGVLVEKVEQLQTEVSKEPPEQPIPVIDTTGIEKTIASLSKEVKKVDRSEEILNPINENMEVMKEILAYLKAPKRVVRDKDGKITGIRTKK
jgi:DNA repair exonuclease SbcCD ATPase subunit